jgi:hypothetical protein
MNNSYFQHNDSAEEFDKNNQSTPVSKTNGLKNFWNKIQTFILKKWWLILLVVIALSLIFVSTFAYIIFQSQNNQSLKYDNISLKITGPDTVSKGSPETWEVSIQNKEESSLSNVVISLNLDPNFEFIQSESITPDNPKGTQYTINRLDGNNNGLSQGLIKFKGTSKGNIDEDIIITGSITYTPDSLVRLKNAGRVDENTNTRLSLPLPQKTTRTTAAKIALFMATKDDIVANNAEAQVNLEIENLSERDIKDLRIRYYYPQGFTYTDSILSQDSSLSTKKKPDEGNNIWLINNLARLNKQKLILNGTVTGTGGISLTFRADLEIRNGDRWESISTISRDVTLASKPLVLATSIENNNGLFTPGQTLNFIVNYENQGTNTVRDAEIIGSVQDPADILDWSTLQFEGGNRGSTNNKTITWAGNNLPQLANLGIRAKGQLRYSIKVKQEATFINTIRDQGEYILVPQASANGKNIQPIQVIGETLKAKGDINFVQKITPLPFSEGQLNKRRFRVSWELTNKQNQVDLVVIRTRTVLPQNSWVPSSITPVNKASQIVYNPQNGEIIWNAGIIPSYSGISKPSVNISFDFEVEDTIGGSSKIELYKEISITGKDNFTQEQFAKASPSSSVQFNVTVNN